MATKKVRTVREVLAAMTIAEGSLAGAALSAEIGKLSLELGGINLDVYGVWSTLNGKGRAARALEWFDGHERESEARGLWDTFALTEEQQALVDAICKTSAVKYLVITVWPQESGKAKVIKDFTPIGATSTGTKETYSTNHVYLRDPKGKTHEWASSQDAVIHFGVYHPVGTPEKPASYNARNYLRKGFETCEKLKGWVRLDPDTGDVLYEDKTGKYPYVK